MQPCCRMEQADARMGACRRPALSAAAAPLVPAADASISAEADPELCTAPDALPPPRRENMEAGSRQDLEALLADVAKSTVKALREAKRAELERLLGGCPPTSLGSALVCQGPGCCCCKPRPRQAEGRLVACLCLCCCGRACQAQGNRGTKQEACFARRAATRASRAPARLGPCHLQRSVGSGAAGSATSGLRCSKRSCRRFACRCGLWPWTERRKALSRSPLTWRHSCCQPG